VKQLTQTYCRILLFAFGATSVSWNANSQTQSPPAAAPVTNQIRIVELQGRVEISPAGGIAWSVVESNRSVKAFDRLRTGLNSRMALRWSDESVIPFGASTELEILPPQTTDQQSGLHLVRGVLSFFHRDKPGRIRVITRGATAGIEGTEFVLSVNDTDRTTVSVVDGRVRFGNEQASLVLTNGQQAIAEVGQAPQRTAGFIANNILQWCFYYPAVLDPAELPLSDEEQNVLAESLAAYRAGDLLAALASYPAGRTPGSDAERVYYAALLLSVGQVEASETALTALSTLDASARPQRLANSLRHLIAAVKHEQLALATPPELATELLAQSYYEQSRGVRESSLQSALILARQAVTISPGFGFAWARVAELEFSFGNTRKALEALEKSLSLSPRNAQALALKGFLLAAENNTREAITWFDRALTVDSALANAWLGRGLCRIRRGDVSAGREDLLIAAALEPQRADLRSYLAKAYAMRGEDSLAVKELQLAKNLDANDPTPWLHSALINQNNNRVNDAIRDLEKSEELNDNRSVYRSQLLLNQDHAVRSANLANIYSDAGMTDVSVREASRAVTYDYASYSAHLFLANSYEVQRGYAGSNLRYETPAFSEYLIANLLAPVGAGPLSPIVSQQEYSPLFEQDRLGLVSQTEYLSRGAWQQNFAQYGTYETFNYSLEGIYVSDPGQRNNNDFEEKALSLTLKQQITPQDTAYFNINGFRRDAGDISQVYDPANGNTALRTKEETEDPNLAVGLHHQWSPGVHTLLLLGRQVDTFSFTNANAGALVTVFDGSDILGAVITQDSMKVRNSQTLYSAELQQIIEQPDHSTVFGGLYQHTDFTIRDFEQSFDVDIFTTPPYSFPPTIADMHVDTDFQRASVYGYHSWQILDPLLLVGGLSYDWMSLPQNLFSPPFANGKQETKSQVSPKAGFIWTPVRNTVVRGAYARSLTGASIDQGYRLEPTQVAGLNQSYRSLASESLVGSTPGASLDTYVLSAEQKFATGTYVAVTGELLYSDASREIGTYYYDVNLDNPYGVLTDKTLKENLDYQEESLLVTVDQLLDREWAAGVRYRLTKAELDESLADVPEPPADPGRYIQPRQHLDSLLHQVNLHLNFNHASGLFSSFEAIWYYQSDTGFTSGQPEEDLWQFNLLGGYRFCHRRATLELGVLNITDQDYRLDPLTVYNVLPRERTFVTRFQFSF
jgi:Flp pilus assembly protein TadD